RWGGPPGDASRFMETELLPTLAARDVAVTDLDGDGIADIVFANHHDGTGSLDVDSIVYWGTASGYDASVSTALPTHGATDVLVADLDADGRTDIVFCNSGTGLESEPDGATDSYVYWNTGMAAPFEVGERTAFPTEGCASVHAADANADGTLDLFFAGWHDGAGGRVESRAFISAPGRSRHRDSASTLLPDPFTWQVLPGDVDGDGLTDLVVLPWQDPVTGSWETPGRSLYGVDAAVPTWSTTQSSLLPSAGGGNGVLADLNLDGFDDVILPGYRDDTGVTAPGTTLWFGRPSGLSTSATFVLDTPNARTVAAGDVDRDGLLDLVFLGSTAEDVAAEAFVYIAAEPPSPTSGYDTLPNRSLGGVHVTLAPPLLVGPPD
ncbi:MAG: VCBS repeat-containing protein, partial [Myxococcota bacterium]|nr:VCBS repeat-containing protein [Myxococcota bacterium]